LNEGSNSNTGRDKSKRKNENMTWEEKQNKRTRDEGLGKIEPRVAAHVIDGGKYSENTKMSRDEYKKKHNDYGTIGIIDQMKEANT